MPPRVSVILPTHNRARTLPRALQSVLSQTYQDFETIVVDDASTDDTAGALAPFLNERVRCLRLKTNRGAAAARNAGVREAAGEFLAFQDSDDEWLPDKLAVQIAAMEKHPDVCVVYGDMERVLASGETQPFPAPDVITGRIADRALKFYQVCNIGIQSTLIRRSCVNVDAMFDEALPSLEDLELFFRLSRTQRFHHLRRCLVRYHESPGLSADDVRRFAARDRLLRLHGREIRRKSPVFWLREWINVQRGKRRVHQR